MSGLNWQKKFSHCSISGSVAPSSMQKLWTPLATIFVEKKFEKNFGVVLDPFELPHERNFWYPKKNHFEIFRTSEESRASDQWNVWCQTKKKALFGWVWWLVKYQNE